MKNQTDNPKQKMPIKINWKLFIVSFLVLNIGSFIPVILYAILTGTMDLNEDIYLAITLSQIVMFYLTGLMMGYWAGEWPRFEMTFLFITSIQTSLSRNLKEGLDFPSGLMMVLCLALYGVSFWGGGFTGIKLKQRKMKQIQFPTESEVSNGD